MPSQGSLERLEMVFDLVKGTFHVGFMPLVLWLGWTLGPDNGAPPFCVTNFIWYY